DAPSAEQARVEIVGQDVLAEIRVRYDAASIAAARSGILCGWIQEIAVGYEVVVRVDPRPCHTRGTEGGRGLGHAQAWISVGVVARHPGALEVPADRRLDCGAARSEDVIHHAHPRREVLVAVHAAGFRDDNRRWQESG